MMGITRSREEFEVYIRKNFQYPTLEMEPEDGPCAGEYVDTMREEQFQLWDAAWQASRESISVVLEDIDSFSPNDCGDEAVWLTELARALRTAGIRIKGEGDGN